jgi:hypothetical protein
MFGDGVLTDDESRAVFMYSCEWVPREVSLYHTVNQMLRDKDRSKALPFLPYIKLLCTALSKVLNFFSMCCCQGREFKSKRMLCALLEKCPSDHSKLQQILRPTAGILWRGVALDLEAVYLAKLGKTIVFWGFTSTTSDMAALDAFIPEDSPQRTLFSITTGLAADLAPYSAFPGDGELLIPAGHVFEVVNVKRFSRSAPRPWPDATRSERSRRDP